MMINFGPVVVYTVPSQVVLQRTLTKKQGLMSVATKIAIQMNCKMGGDVWGCSIPVSTNNCWVLKKKKSLIM